MRLLSIASVLGVVVFLPAAASADTRCSQANGFGVQLCESGISTTALAETFKAQGSSRQERQNWCWAASISMAFRHAGYEVSQTRIVEETIGVVADVPGQGYQIHEALDRNWVDDNGRQFQVSARVYDLQARQIELSNQDIIQELDAGRPLVYGAMGHATLLTAAKYFRNAMGQVQVLEGTVRDPWPGSPARRTLSAAEMSPIFVATAEIVALDDRRNRRSGSTTSSSGGGSGAVCDWATKLAADAPNEFAAYQGAQRRTSDRFNGTLIPPGADFCILTPASRSKARYYCASQDTTRSSARAALTPMIASLDRCLAGWRRSAEPDTADTLLDTRWTKPGVDVGASISISDGKAYWELVVRQR